MRPLDIQVYRLGEDLSEPILYGMLVFSPWAFGTTQPWSIGIMNAAGYVLGALLALKLAIRWLKGYHPPRWDEAWLPGRLNGPRRRRLAARGLTATLGVVTLLTLAYCLVSAWNARATYEPAQVSFVYHECIRWLPHSLDSGRSWQAFWNYLALACAFWAVRDWLLGKTEAEQRAEPAGGGLGVSRRDAALPARFRRLLWVLAINGALLGLEGIAQRLEGSGRLLFMVKPRVNPGAVAQFGPYAYRANASQYFNLVWPACLGFWFALRGRGGRRRGRPLLLLCAAIMAACPIISTSRAGAIIAVGILVLGLGVLGVRQWMGSRLETGDGGKSHSTLIIVALFAVVVLGLGYALGWKALAPRLAHLSEIAVRESMYAAAQPMADDYPIYGTGPGTFDPIFQLYRASLGVYWPAQLHNDWLETRITFGLAGSSLLWLALALVLLRWFALGGIGADRRFMILLWLGLAGCLFHARYDFPFQIYSILFLFLVLCAVLSAVTRRPVG